MLLRVMVYFLKYVYCLKCIYDNNINHTVYINVGFREQLCFLVKCNFTYSRNISQRVNKYITLIKRYYIIMISYLEYVTGKGSKFVYL